MNRDTTKVSEADNRNLLCSHLCLVAQVKESKASLVTIPLNVLSMLEIAKEEMEMENNVICSENEYIYGGEGRERGDEEATGIVDERKC